MIRSAPAPHHAGRDRRLAGRLDGESHHVYCTVEESAQEILKHGVKISRTSPESTWGQGFYSSMLPERQYGPVAVPVAVRLTQPFIVRDSVSGLRQIDELLEQTKAATIHDAVLAAGFDGVVIHFGLEQAWVIAYDDAQVKIVVRGPARG